MNIQFENFSLEFILLFSSLLLVLSVLASRISSSFGVPALLLFLGIGMLAGSEGPGKFPFENYSLAFSIGSVCLAFIMFDGGIRTSWSNVRPILPLGVSLSIIGTISTGVVTGIFAHLIFGLGWTEGLLLGSIVSSTDAAAVFSILRSKKLALHGRLKQILEFEAGSNDPVAVFLTMAVITYSSAGNNAILDIFVLFFKQAILGLLMGWLGTKSLKWLINKSGVEFEGLYGVLVVGFIILLFSLTSYIGGSGFLAAYVAGLSLGNSIFLHKASVVRFLDGIGWISQIIIFLVLGLLAFPSNLLLVWKEGILIALFMMFIARPLSVLIASPLSKLEKKERLFISWIGLRGAAPVILATLPWSLKLPNAEYYFNLVFFIVIVSVVIQGISIPWVAKKLKVIVPYKNEPQPNGHLSILPPGSIVIEMEVEPNAFAVAKRIVDLKIPSGVLFTAIERGGRFLIPQGNTVFSAGDKVWGVARSNNLEILESLFGKINI